MIAPGRWLGMLGGGQLGRMFCFAAQSMGYRVAVLDPDAASPAAACADLHLCADYRDAHALEALAQQCEAITTEFENVPAETLAWLARSRRVAPAADAVAIAQDRIREKQFVASCGIDVAPHAVITHLDDLAQVSPALYPGILKVSRLGYDGKGQARVASPDEAREAYLRFGGVPCVLERRLDLAFEVSVVCARGADGAMVTYPLADNVHRDGILAVSTLPAARASAAQRAAATAHARTIAERLAYVGVLCVEFFVLNDGRVLVNEMAPRPHNSGHATIDACITSQFEQQVRTLAGLPLGAVEQHSPAIMLNLLGDLWFDAHDHIREPDWSRVLALPGAKLHLYGKAEPRRARKMGHVTCVGSSPEQVRATADAVCDILALPR